MKAKPDPKPELPRETELELQRRVRLMRDAELLDFIRDTTIRLEVLADRFDAFARSGPMEGNSDAAR